MKKILFLVVTIFPFYSFALQTQLSSEEIDDLRERKEIVRVEELEDEVFPRVTLINLIPHSPTANMRVFTDFENHKKFIPGLKMSKIVEQDGNLTDVFFELEMPIISNTKYTTRHNVTYENDRATLTWDLLDSDQIRGSKGMIRFEEFEGETLYTYVSHITPKSSLAWTVKGRVVPDVKKTNRAIIEHLEKTAKTF